MDGKFLQFYKAVGPLDQHSHRLGIYDSAENSSQLSSSSS